MLTLDYIPDITKSRYLDVYEGIYAEMVYANKFNENSDLSITYLVQTEMIRDTKIKAEEQFPITGQGFASGKLLDGMECQILLDTVLQSHTCQSHTTCGAKLYIHCQNFLQIHKEFKWVMDNMSVYFFVIPVIVDIHGLRFQIFTLVSKIHDNVDLVMGMKNIFEMEGVIDS